MQLSVIFVSYNTKDLLRNAIGSIPERKDWEIIVVDNASSDGSVQMLNEEFPKVKIIPNSENLGFAKANNQGIKASKGKYVLLLNTDTVVKEHALENLLEFLERQPEVGIASGQLLNPDGSIQPQGGNLPRLSNLIFWMLFIDDLPIIGKYLWPYHLNDPAAFRKERRFGWVGGTAMLIKRKLIEKIGLLDEEIFMYAEDVDFCIRAQKAGFLVAITPQAKIIHFGQQSSGGAPSAAWLGEYKGIKYIFKKHKAAWEYPVLRLLLKVGALLRMFVFGILGGRRDAYAAYRQAFALA